MAMTNVELKRMIDTYGDRMFTIQFNNAKHLFIGYNNKGAVKISDIELLTENNIDYICIKHKDPSNPNTHWKMYYTTEFIECVGIIDEDSLHFPDPILLK